MKAQSHVAAPKFELRLRNFHELHHELGKVAAAMQSAFRDLTNSTVDPKPAQKLYEIAHSRLTDILNFLHQADAGIEQEWIRILTEEKDK